MSGPIVPEYQPVDGLSIRFAQSGPGQRDVLLLSPGPESIFGCQQVWMRLSRSTYLVAVDLPGFDRSERRPSLMNPRSIGAVGAAMRLAVARDASAAGRPV